MAEKNTLGLKLTFHDNDFQTLHQILSLVSIAYDKGYNYCKRTEGKATEIEIQQDKSIFGEEVSNEFIKLLSIKSM